MRNDLFGDFDFCGKHDIEAMDLTGYFFPDYPKAPADNYRARIKRSKHDRGITISGTGAKNDFPAANKGVRAEGVALTKVWLEVAARLGATGPPCRIMATPSAPARSTSARSSTSAHGLSLGTVEGLSG